MDLKNIRLIGMDLDGTLLNDDKELCRGARQTIMRAAKRGVQIVPVTGRPISGVPECIRKIKEIKYIISSNGAQILRADNGRALFSFQIGNEKSREIIALLRSFGCLFEPFTDGYGYCEQNLYDYYRKNFIGTPVENYIFTSRKICDSYETLFADGSKCADEFFVNCPDEKTRGKLCDALDSDVTLQYCNLGDRFIEITRKNADKGNALLRLSEHIGVSQNETLAFGDGENDILFLESAGVSVAMENAHPSVRKHADYIAKSNNENGVCEFIESKILARF